MCKYVRAKEGNKFVLTELGFEDKRIRHKFSEDYIQKEMYSKKVPEKWLLDGLVMEVSDK